MLQPLLCVIEYNTQNSTERWIDRKTEIRTDGWTKRQTGRRNCLMLPRGILSPSISEASFQVTFQTFLFTKIQHSYNIQHPRYQISDKNIQPLIVFAETKEYHHCINQYYHQQVIYSAFEPGTWSVAADQ